MISNLLESIDLLELVYTGVTLIVTTVIIPILKEVFQYVKGKTQSSMYMDTIIKIENLVEQAILSTSQTYVDSLKSQKTFDEDSQKLAFDKTKDSIKNMLTTEMENFIVYYHKNLDAWLDTKIEQLIKKG